MKYFLHLIATVTLVFFMSACSSSDGGAGGGASGASGDVTKSGTLHTTLNGEEITWYTSRFDNVAGSVNKAVLGRGDDGSISILIIANRTIESTNDDDDLLMFGIEYLSGGVTTGQIPGGMPTAYRVGETTYGFYVYTLNITSATDNGVTVHLEGTATIVVTNLADGSSATMDMDFVLDATETVLVGES